jgi:hypothetical protein
MNKLIEAASDMLEHYRSLVHSGDAGSWDPDTEEVVIKLRQAIDDTRKVTFGKPVPATESITWIEP